VTADFVTGFSHSTSELPTRLLDAPTCKIQTLSEPRNALAA
jgi:hypothetical protein